MSTMKRLLISALLAVAFAMLCGAQNVNPTVQVTNDYLTRMSDVKKKGVEMHVPDSLYDFDYEFDYSVFDSPYKGAYEFSPYTVRMTPSPEEFSLNRFHLRAGAGYSFHPQAGFTYAPVNGEKFSFGLFGDASGFSGKYSGLGSDLRPDSETPGFSGHDYSDKVGLGGKWSGRNGTLGFEAGHEGAYADDLSYNSAYGTLRLSSLANASSFLYDAALHLRYGKDLASGQEDGSFMTETDVLADLSIGPVFREKYKFLLDASLEFDSLQGTMTSDVSTENPGKIFYSIKPHADFYLGPVRIDAGVKLDHSQAFHVYPDISAELTLGKEGQVAFYALLTGGDEYNTYHSFKMANHRFNALYADCGYSREKLKGLLGLRGYFLSRVQYELSGGWSSRSSSPLESISPLGNECLTYADYNMVFADASLSWRSESFDAIARLAYRKTSAVLSEGSDFPGAYALPVISGSLQMRYNAGRRFFIGLGAEGRGSRSLLCAEGADIPGFVDLGAEAEYRFSPRLGFWVKGGNLLCQPLRRSLLFVEKSPSLTVGINLTL